MIEHSNSTPFPHKTLFWVCLVAAAILGLWKYCNPEKASAGHPPKRAKAPHKRAKAKPKYFTEDPALARIQRFRGPLPGLSLHPYALGERLERAYRAKGKAYKPRTHHFQAKGLPRYHNRLLFETSPYLLQHAHNPVNWHPWGKAAFAKARKENKPVLLSVGYATCHWCHVMERESFENPKIAAYMNKHYIAIKVDREERTDVDGIYMQVVQMLTGSGGWPMTVWLTPARKPYYGGTYFPPKDRWGRRGFLRTLKLMVKRYKTNPAGIQSRAKGLIQRLRAFSKVPASSGVPGPYVLHRTASLYKRIFDPVYGGMQRRIKFPSSLSSSLLLRYYRRTRSKKALHMATLTLEKMCRGGMYDQVAGGFHRYSTDRKWLVPHFEKMLYDNALLTLTYLEGAQVTQRDEFARIATEILDYVAREMTHPKGPFYSATDADSEGHEGKFFVWTPAQLDRILGPKLSAWTKRFYSVSKGGNFEGKNILHIPQEPKRVARSLKTTPKALHAAIQLARNKLYHARKKRIPPLRDDKVITSWNALMISAFAKAALLLRRPDYAKRASNAANFLLKHLRVNRRLRRTYKDGQAKHNAYLEDYAFSIAALLDLFEATQELRWLREALSLQNTLQRFYHDAKQGGYFRTSSDHEKLLIRPKPNYDGAVPTGNSIQAMNLLRLYEFTAKPHYRNLAAGTFKAFGKRLYRSPSALSEMLLALDFYHDKAKQIILVKPSATSSVTPFLRHFRKQFLPNRVLIITTPNNHKLEALVPLVKKKRANKGKVTAYVCTQQVCELPTTDPAVFAKQLRKTQRLTFPKLR